MGWDISISRVENGARDELIAATRFQRRTMDEHLFDGDGG